jgi:hypothetical protein
MDGEEMKNVISTVLAIMLFTLIFCTWSLADSGGDTFKARCAICHGANGNGSTAMGKTLNLRDLGSAEVQIRCRLNDNYYQRKRQNAEIRRQIDNRPDQRCREVYTQPEALSAGAEER